jgi:hypothetical protein
LPSRSTAWYNSQRQERVAAAEAIAATLYGEPRMRQRRRITSLRCNLTLDLVSEPSPTKHFGGGEWADARLKYLSTEISRPSELLDSKRVVPGPGVTLILIPRHGFEENGHFCCIEYSQRRSLFDSEPADLPTLMRNKVLADIAVLPQWHRRPNWPPRSTPVTNSLSPDRRSEPPELRDVRLAADRYLRRADFASARQELW